MEKKEETVDNDILKECHKNLLEILLYFDAFCREHRLEYIIASGTAIGALRHQGFIPWDDDIDLLMHSDDIEKLIKLWDKEADTSRYFLQYKQSDKYYNSVVLKIRKNGTTCVDKRYTFVPMHWGIAIDIFPFYNAPRTVFGRRLMEILYKAAYKIAKISTEHFNWPGIFIQFSSSLTIFLLKCLKCLSDHAGENDYLFRPSYYGETPLIKRTDFYPLTEYCFEGHKVLGAAKTHKILKQKYGNYMKLPPEEKRVPGHQFIVDPYKDYSEYMTRM